ncbi:MAG: hypothetical protein IJN17_01765 [Clostridia bacterium]|nr:hypothetical protein [Clostridia bacterium]
MKRNVKFLCFIMGLLLAFTFASCKKDNTEAPVDETEPIEETVAETEKEEEKEPETFDELWTLIDSKMEGIDSWEIELGMQSIVYYGGFKMEMSMVGKTIEIGDIEDADYYSFEKTTYETKVEGVDKAETQVMIEAYSDGKAFYHHAGSEYTRSFYMETTPEKYSEYSSGGGFTDDLDLTSCLNKAFTKNDDGTWTLNLSGYTKKTIKDLLRDSAMEDVYGGDIIDLKLEVKVAEDYLVQTMSLELVFDVDESDVAVPTLTMSAKYKNFGTAQKETAELNVESYTLIDDYTVISKALGDFDAFTNEKEGSFTLDTKYTISKGTEVMEYTEKDVATFGTVNGGFVFNVDALFDGVDKANMSYEKGVFTYTENGETETDNLTDADAKVVFFDMISGFSYDENSISDVEKLGEGEYKLTVEYSDESIFNDIVKELELEYKSYDEVYIVTIKEDKLVSIENDLKIYGVFNKNGTEELVEYRIHSFFAINNAEKAPSVA